MHVATALLIILVVWLSGDWKDWKTYHNTMLFVAVANLLYNFSSMGHYLWQHQTDFISNHTMAELLYTFIVLPGTVLLFLKHFPHEKKLQVFHYVKWISIYFVWEVLFAFSGRIVYQNGWTLWWSLAFLSVMFPLIRLHHSRPILTYILSGIIAVLVLWFFEVPIHLPVEQRIMHSINIRNAQSFF